MESRSGSNTAMPGGVLSYLTTIPHKSGYFSPSTRDVCAPLALVATSWLQPAVVFRAAFRVRNSEEMLELPTLARSETWFGEVSNLSSPKLSPGT
jgi:hypothetical protein